MVPNHLVLTEPTQAFPLSPVDTSAEATLKQFEPLVRAIARHLSKSLPSWVEVDDLVQWGQVGLLHAISRYSEERNVKFSTYAKYRIRGAMLDGLRELDWAPRNARAGAKRFAEAQARFEAAHGRPATDDELAAVLDLTVEQVRDRLHQVVPEMVSLHHGSSGEGSSDWDQPSGQPSPFDFVMSGQLRDRLSAAMDLLPERDRVVLRSYYWDSQTMAEIAKQLGVNESRICQVRKRAMERLRVILSDVGIAEVA